MELGDAGGKESGVDGPGDGRMVGELGDDGETEDFGDVRRPEAAPRLADEDHAVVAVRFGAHEPAEGEVAGSPHHDVVLGRVRAAACVRAAGAVDDDEVGVPGGLGADEVELVGHSDGRLRRRGDQAQQGRHVVGVVGDELGGLRSCAEESEGGRDGARPLSAAGCGDRDGPGCGHERTS